MSKIYKLICGKNLITFIAIILCIFHLYTGVVGLLPSPQQRAIHVSLTLILVFLMIPAKKEYQKNKLVNIFNFLLITICLISGIYIYLYYRRFLPLMISLPNIFESILAILTIIAILEAGRRTIGMVFPLLTLFMLLYAFFGHFIPGEFGHAPFAVGTILKTIYFSADGIWGFLTGLSSTYLALFIIFGSFLLSCGSGQTFINIALFLTGRFTGGPAKAAVLSSGFFAMISGSGMANVATTGNFTIPLMKKLGYKAEFAAAVESVASSGGVFTPPIMGAAAFIMAEFLGIPYLKVIIAAAIPSFFYYLAVFTGVHFQAIKLGLKPIPREDLPLKKEIFVFSKLINLFVPIILLIYFLFKGFTLTFVGVLACISSLLLYIFPSFSLDKIRRNLASILEIFEEGGKSLINIVPILVCANIVLGLLNFTGLTIKFSRLIMSMGTENIITSLIMTAFLVMILGCGLPATAAYVIGVTAAMPLLLHWGFSPIATHLFILYYSVLALITPPVCGAVFVASAIAKSNWLRTAGIAMSLVPIVYILPFIFIFDNSYLLIGNPIYIFFKIITASIGIIVLQSGLRRQLIMKCNIYESLLLIGSGLSLIIPGWKTGLIGLIIFLFILIKQLLNIKKINLKIS